MAAAADPSVAEGYECPVATPHAVADKTFPLRAPLRPRSTQNVLVNMRVKIEYVTVSKVFMFEPWPLDLDYWYNGTRLGHAFSAAFNESRLVAPGAAFSNWYQMAQCKDVFGATALHPVTRRPFICGFEVRRIHG